MKTAYNGAAQQLFKRNRVNTHILVFLFIGLTLVAACGSMSTLAPTPLTV